MIFLNIKKVSEKTTLARSTIYKLIKEKKFPEPIKLAGTNRVAWHEHMVEEWMSNTYPR